MWCMELFAHLLRVCCEIKAKYLMCKVAIAFDKDWVDMVLDVFSDMTTMITKRFCCTRKGRGGRKKMYLCLDDALLLH